MTSIVHQQERQPAKMLNERGLRSPERADGQDHERESGHRDR
jgi:hypothetical protein